jgi:C-terminal processing protease CtpA/Prc
MSLLHPALALLISAAALAGPAAVAAAVPGLRNGPFSEGEIGKVPDLWFHPKASQEAGYQVAGVAEASLPGGRAARISRAGGGQVANSFGNLMQLVDAIPFRGKRVRLSTRLRLDSAGQGLGRAWLRVDLPDHKTGFFDNMDKRPVTASDWTPVTIVGDIDAQATQLALGVILHGERGGVRIAPVTLEILGDTPALAKEPARALSTQGCANLVALARAFSYLRFFAPSDEAAQTDWNRLAGEAVRAVETAEGAAELAKRLSNLFAAAAPGAQFLTAEQRPAPLAVPAEARFAARWRHVGFGQGLPQNAYQSSREYLESGARAAQGWPDPALPSVFELGAGVRLAMATVAFADQRKATLPIAAVPTKDAGGLPEPTAGQGGSGDDRATRLGDVLLLWGVLEHFYPYFEVVGGDWNAELPRALQRAALDPDAAAFQTTLRTLVAALHDGHGSVYFGGAPAMAVPSLALVLVDGQVIVRFAGASAQTVAPGSRILSIDGKPVEARIAELKATISAASEGWLASRLQAELLAGKAGAAVQVTFVAADGRKGEASLPRDAGPWNLEDLNPSRPAPITELRPGVWYVDLSRYEEKPFKETLGKLAAAKGVIFDLRGYPKGSPEFLQHLTDKPLQSARWNIPVVSTPDRKLWEWKTSGRWELPPLEPRIRGKVAFLTGGGAISYAESCLGIVEAYHLAEIVGAASAGTNGNVNVVELPGGYRIPWTGMKVLKHDGSRHHGVGILPTIPVQPTLQTLAEGRDAVLAKALEVVDR